MLNGLNDSDIKDIASGNLSQIKYLNNIDKDDLIVELAQRLATIIESIDKYNAYECPTVPTEDVEDLLDRMIDKIEPLIKKTELKTFENIWLDYHDQISNELEKADEYNREQYYTYF